MRKNIAAATAQQASFKMTPRLPNGTAPLISLRICWLIPFKFHRNHDSTDAGLSHSGDAETEFETPTLWNNCTTKKLARIKHSRAIPRRTKQRNFRRLAPDCSSVGSDGRNPQSPLTKLLIT
jgi:hypothetical protein